MIGEHATLGTFIKTLVPLSLALFNIINNKTYFGTFSGIAAIIPLLIPTLLRNYTKVSVNLDYSMILLANFSLLLNFVAKFFTEDSYMEQISSLFQSKNIMLQVTALTFLLDILLSLFGTKGLKLSIRTFYSLCLISAAGALQIKSDMAILGVILLVVPVLMLLLTDSSDKRWCLLSTIITLYCAIFTCYIELNIAANGQTGFRKYLNNGTQLLRKMPFVKTFF